MADSQANVRNNKANSKEPEFFQKHWFCAALYPSGSTYKNDAESPADFLGVLKDSAIAWVDYWTTDFDQEAPVAASNLGFSSSLIASLIDEPHLTYQDFETEMCLRLPTIQVRQLNVEPYPLLLFLRKNFILTIHPVHVDRRFIRLRRYSDTILKKVPLDACAEDKLTLLLLRIINETNERNFEHLRQIEEQGDELNREMMDPATSRDKLGPKIYEMKHALITYLNALWQTVSVVNALRYGDAELITNDPKLLDRMSVLADDVNRQIGLGEHLSEVLASGLEVLQTIYNNQLQAFNNRLALVMAYLTIVGTAVLVPNTLATIMGNSAFDMKGKDVGWYIALLVGSTAVATGLVYWWVRKWGWIPKKMD